MADGEKDHAEDLDGMAKDIHKFKQEFAQVREAWRTKLTKRGGLHWWVDVWGEAAKVSHYATAKLVAVAIPLSYALGVATGVGGMWLYQRLS